MPNLPNISPELLKAYQEEIERRTSGATVKRKMSALRRFFSWAEQKGHIEESPIPTTSQATFQPVQLQTTPKEKEETKQPTPSKDIKQAQRWLTPANAVRGGILVALVVLVLLLVGRVELPIPFRKTPATDQGPTATPTDTPAQQPAILSPWTLYARLTLTRQDGSPVIGSQSVTFKLYQNEEDTSPLHTFSPKEVTTDQEGSTLVALDEVPTELFFENEKLFLGGEIDGSELSTRLPVSTANQSANLQGFYPAQEAGANTIPVLSSDGSLLLAAEAPSIRATSGNLLVEGNTLTLSTPDVSDGDITINPDGSGTANFIFEGTGGNLINAQASNIISGSLYSGTVANDATGYNLITLQSGSETTTKFSVDALGNTYVGANLDIEHDLSTGGEKRLTSEGKLENITGYEQESGNFSITQDGGDTASISKKNVTALSDLLTLTLDERGKPETSNSIYSTLVLRRYDGATEAMALHVDEGNATFDGQLRLGRFDTNPSTIGTGTLIFNSTDGNVYVWTGTSWVSLGGLTGSSIWSRSSGVIFPTTSTDDLAVGGTDSTSAFFVNDSGTITFSTDTNLYRSAANTLRTDDNLSVGGTISGDGSGLTNVNADTLDSLDSTQFLRSDTSDNYTSGTLTFDSGTTLDVNGDFSVADTNISFDGASTTFTFTGAATLSSSSVTASDAFSVNGNATLGDANTDTVTYNARISSDIVPSADSTYDLGSNTLRWANVYADNLVGTISPGFTEGSIVFADASGDLAQDNANLFFDDTNDLVGIGTNSPIAKLQVEGAVTGKALSIFNETGDQDIFTASASGTTRVRVTNAGNLYITGTLNTVSGNLTIDSAGGQTTVNDNLVVTGTSDLQGNVSNSTGDLTISDNLVVTGTSDLQGAVSNSTGNLNLNDSVDVSGDLAVNGGDITSTQTTFNLLNSTPTTINFGGAATTLSIGAGTGTTTVNNNVSVIGNTTLGDTTADTVTYNARVSSDIVPSVDSTYDLGTNTLRWANVYADNLVGTISPGFSEGSIVFTNASGDLAEDNANLFFDDTNDLVGIGTNNPTSKLHVSGAVTGKALVIFDETGDQDILTASASGTTRVRITNGGNLYITGTLNTVSGNLTLDSAGGQTSVSDNFVVTGTSDLQGNVSNSTGNLTLDDTVDVTGNLDTAGTLAVGTSDALTVDTSGNLTTAGDIAVNGGDITTTQSTFNLLNATPTTINFGGAATTLSIGASSGTTTVNNALTVTGTLTANGDIDLGDANTDTVTFTARVDSNIVPSADSTYDLGTNTLRWANVYADNLVGTISPGFTEGSIVFADSNGDLAQDNANLFFDDTNDLVGIGTNSPTSRLHVTGAVTGKALATFDETGDQNILTASASGTTVANLDRSGNLAIDGTISDLNGTKLIVDDDLQVNGDTIFDSGGANRIQLGSTIAFTGNASVSQALSVDGNTTLGDSDTDSVTFNADVASNIIPATDSTYDLGSNTVRWANVYADNLVGTVSPGFTQGSIVFADANGDLAEDNASLFFDDTNNLVGVGTNSPTSKLHVTGAVTGKALSIFDETGDQNILTASASGTTRFVIENDGDVGINTSSPGETLDVSGTGRFYDQTPSTGVTTLTLRAGQGQVSNALLRWQNDSGGSLGSINTTGVGIGQDVSDERLRVWQNGSGESALFEKASGASGETVVITNDGSGNSFLVNDESSDTSPFVIDTSGKVGVGLSSPVGKLDVTGAVTGKALAIFDETGDQNILTASASGTTVANLDGSGNLQIEGTISDLTDATLTVDDGLQVNGNTTLGDTTGDTITFTARATSDLLPSTDNTYDLGSASLQWAEIRGVAIYQNGNQVCDSTGANCPSGGDAGPWNETTGIVHLDTTSWQVSIGDTTTEHKLEVEGAVTGKALVSLWEKGDQDILVASNSATPTNVFRLANDGSIVSAGDAAINGGDLTSSQTTFNLLNTTVTTLNLGGAATALEVGAASGTTSINNSLTIDGNTTIGDASGDSVTANASTWTFANDTNFALSGGINGLSFDTDTFSVDATNNLIGIGTTSPVGKLHLTGAVTGKALSIFNETGDQDIFTASASGTTRMTLDNSGNLGIGADPTARLHLAKDDASTNTQIELARLDRSTSGTAAANIGQYISFYNETDNGTLMQAGRLQFDSHIVSNVAEPDAGGNNASRFRLFVERETWDDFTPAFGAYVTGGDRYLCMNGTDSDNLSTWDCFGMTIGSANSVNLVFDGTNRYTMNYDSGSSQVELYATNIADDLELKTLGSQPISFDTSDDGTDVYIQSDGNVGIGTVSPTSKLHLDGAITGKALSIFDETGDQAIFTASQSGTPRFTIENSGDITWAAATPSLTFNNGETLSFSDGTNDLVAIKDQDAYAFFNLKGKGTTGDPASCAEGDIYYNAADDTVSVCHSGNTWEQLDGGGGGGGGSSVWTHIAHAVYPNDYWADDVLVGGNSTASATFRIAANGNLDSSNNTIDWSLNNAADALNIDSNTLSVDASNDRIGVGTTGPDAKIDSLSTTGEQLRLTYTDGSVYTGFTTDSAGDLTIDATGGDIIFSDTDTLNIGGSGSQVAYNAIADTVAGASGNVDSDDDLYIEGNLEVDGDIYDASGNVVAGYWTLSGSNLYATSTDYLVGVGTNSPISRLHVATNTTTLTGKSAFIVDQLESEDILSASASGTTKMTLTNDGTLKLFNASSTISNTSGDITIDAASNLISFAGDDLSNIGTVTAGTGIFTSALQVADSTAQAYSRLGTATTGHSGNLTAGDDLLISGDLELDSNFYLDGGNISNSSGTATITFTGSPTTAENTLSASSWLIENTANVGKAALMVNQTKAGDILTASASGTTRMTLDNSGNLGLGVDPTAQFHLRKDDASTNTQIELARLDRTTSGTAAANIGQYMSFYNETDNGSLMEAGRFQFDSHIVSNVAEPDAGGNNASRFRLFVERETWDDFTPAFGAYVTGGARYLCMNGTDSDNLSTWDCFGMTIGSANSVNLVFDGTNRYTMNYDSGSSQVELYATNIADDLELKTLGSQPISFDTSDDGTDVYIQSDGNVGIGDTSPSVQLNVGSANTTHGLGASDALISDALEVDGVLYLDGGNISNSAGTASMLLTATPTTATNTLSSSSWLVENTANLGQAALIVNNTKGTDGTTDIFTASASGTTRFRVNRDGGTYITGSAGTLFTVGGGSGKIDVGTVDPVYSIGNEKYATYMAGMIGVKEETTGSVKTTEYVPGYGYRQTIDFTKQEKGSDLWLFSKATDLEKHINDMVVLLSPSDNTRAWYTVNPNNYTLSIYTSRPTSVSYRLTAPRFDADLWTNYNTNPESVGFMLEDNPLTVKEDGEIKEAEDNYIANLEIEDTGKSDGFFETDLLTVFNLKDEAGNIIHEIGQASKFVAANIKAGAIETSRLSTKRFVAFQGQIDSLLVSSGLVSPYIETQTISPIADSDVTVSLDNSEEKDGSSYGRFVVEGEDEKEVATIDSQGNATFSGKVESESVDTNEITASKIYADEIVSRKGKFGEISSATSSAVTLEEIERLLKEAETDQKTLASATDSNIYTATNSATLDEIAATDLYVTNQAAINALSVSESVVVGNDFSIQVIKDELGLAKATSINSLSSPLEIQSLALAPVEIMSGLVSIDTNGDVSIEGNLYVAGNIDSQGLTIRHDDSDPESATNSGFFRLLDSQGQEIAGINASGSANFSQVATDKLVIAGGEATTSASLLDGLVTETNATAGTARITSGVRDITIRSPQITDNTLVYVTPTSTTLNNVLYVKRKGEGFFTAGFNSALDVDVEFNWWVIDVTNPISSTKVSN